MAYRLPQDLQDQLAAFFNTPEGLARGVPSPIPTDITTAPPATPPAGPAPTPGGVMDQLKTFFAPQTPPQAVPPEVAGRLTPEETASYGDMGDVNQAQTLTRLAMLASVLTGGAALPFWSMATVNEAGVRGAKQAPINRALAQEGTLSNVKLRASQGRQAEASAEHLTSEAAKNRSEIGMSERTMQVAELTSKAHMQSANAALLSAMAAMKKADTDALTLEWSKIAGQDFKTMEQLAATISAQEVMGGKVTKPMLDWRDWYVQWKPKVDAMAQLMAGQGLNVGPQVIPVPPRAPEVPAPEIPGEKKPKAETQGYSQKHLDAFKTLRANVKNKKYSDAALHADLVKNGIR